MKIVLLRHGKPNIDEFGKLKANEFHKWVESYNSSGIDRGHLPTSEAIYIAEECKTVVCSDYPRSVESAVLLGRNDIKHIDPVFREMGLAYGRWKTPKAFPIVWASIFRVLWFLGYSSNGEVFSAAKKRATHGANIVDVIAKNTGSFLLVGHGFMNRYIAKELLSSGWDGPINPGKKYWEFGVYEKNATSNGSIRMLLTWRSLCNVSL